MKVRAHSIKCSSGPRDTFRDVSARPVSDLVMAPVSGSGVMGVHPEDRCDRQSDCDEGSNG